MLSITISIICYFLEDLLTDYMTNLPGEAKYFKVCYRIHNYIFIHIVCLNMTIGSIMRSSGK